jgi:arginase family enzyme
MICGMANVVVDFSGIYKRQDLCADGTLKYVDCTDVKGTDGYCDAQAIGAIRDRLTGQCGSDGSMACGIHYIDSGNYHYMSRIFLDWLDQDCVLVVFDNHPDMQPPAFGDILSCGGWLLEAMRDNPHIVKTYVVGVDGSLLVNLPEQVEAWRSGGRLVVLPQENFRDGTHNAMTPECHDRYSLPMNGENIYISIDKDVLSKACVNTNWDQGDMSLDELYSILGELFANNNVIGMDVCGEPTAKAQEGDVFSSASINKALGKIWETHEMHFYC